MKSPQNITILMRRHWKLILLCIGISLTTLILSTLVSIWLSKSHNLRLPSLGTIRTIGVKVFDGDLINGAQIDWGTVYPGTLTNRSFYLQNESNTPITLSLKQLNLTLLNSRKENVTSYLPLPPTDALNLTWNCSNIILNPKQTIFITLTLHVSNKSSFIEFLVNYKVVEFNFDICIEAIPIE